MAAPASIDAASLARHAGPTGFVVGSAVAGHATIASLPHIEEVNEDDAAIFESFRKIAIELERAAREAAAEGLSRPDGSVLITVAAQRAGIPMVDIGGFVKTRLTLSQDRLGIHPLGGGGRTR